MDALQQLPSDRQGSAAFGRCHLIASLYIFGNIQLETGGC